MTEKKVKILGDLDEFDFLILKELRENCKTSIRELSLKVGLHPNTLMQRISKLEKEKIIIKYAAEIDYSKIGYDLHAIIFIKISKGMKFDWNSVNQLRKYKDILAMYAMTGEHDVMLIVKTLNREKLTKLIESLSGEKEILDTYTLLVLGTYKHAYEFNPF